MSLLTLSLNLPESLYRRLEDRARQTNRSVEEESLEVLTTGLMDDDRLPADLETILESMRTLDETALQDKAKGRLPIEISERLEELHMKRQRDGLSQAEDFERADLLDQYERHMLIRAQAAALLARRGAKIANSSQS